MVLFPPFDPSVTCGHVCSIIHISCWNFRVFCSSATLLSLSAPPSRPAGTSRLHQLRPLWGDLSVCIWPDPAPVVQTHTCNCSQVLSTCMLHRHLKLYIAQPELFFYSPALSSISCFSLFSTWLLIQQSIQATKSGTWTSL